MLIKNRNYYNFNPNELNDPKQSNLLANRFTQFSIIANKKCTSETTFDYNNWNIVMCCKLDGSIDFSVYEKESSYNNPQAFYGLDFFDEQNKPILSKFSNGIHTTNTSSLPKDQYIKCVLTVYKDKNKTSHKNPCTKHFSICPEP